MNIEELNSVLHQGKKVYIDWSKVTGPYRIKAQLSIPIIVTYMNGDMKLGRIVTNDLRQWVSETPEVFRVEVQVGTRVALIGEETDLF